MNNYKTRCNFCAKEYEYSADTQHDTAGDYCSADCEQASFDAGDDASLWSERRKAQEHGGKSLINYETQIEAEAAMDLDISRDLVVIALNEKYKSDEFFASDMWQHLPTDPPEVLDKPFSYTDGELRFYGHLIFGVMFK